jgi:hypothetical protein
MDAEDLPVPPAGVRPGHLGLIATGRVILGDIAATAVDLSLRGLLQIKSTGGEAGDWMLTPAMPPEDAQNPLEYEQVLLEWVAQPGYATSLASLAADLPAGLAEVREDLVHDAVHRGWLRHLHHLHHHQRTKAGEELAGHLRIFRRELRAVKAELGPEILEEHLLPYALHFGLAGPGHPLAQFAHAWVAAFAELPEWRGPARPRSDTEWDDGIRPAVHKRTLHEDIMSSDVGGMLWVTGGW